MSFGSHCSQRGRYQFASPRSRIDDGTSNVRTIVASRKTATASPNPICWNGASRTGANPPNTVTMISAAPVMIPAVVRRPYATDSVLSPVLS